MKIESMHIGMRIHHPQYGSGVVKALTEHAAEVRFEDGVRAIAPEVSGIQPAEPRVAFAGLEQPLDQFLEQALEALLQRMGWEKPEAVVDELGTRWQRGRMVLHPSDATLQAKEIPLEVFFHKIIGIRNQLRVLEQKINAHSVLSDADKIEMQQYVSRCYGAMTTFNLLFARKGSEFKGTGQK
ncbi:MAG TPA: hypothetical protein P5186_08455 [Candidatus Paceibacterota bacterium]|nr:hypothetical protein [Verrucomicrobiota bacterium]HRY48063.1 hypothetical protein [Candidatus Paceibacterota bacterium]